MAIAFSNTGKATVASGTITATVTINSGDTVVVTILVHVSGGAIRTITSVVDSSGTNTYTQKTNQANGASGPQTFIWGALNVSSSATTVTVTVSGTFTGADVIVATYTGVGTNGFGNTGVNTGNSSTPTVTATTQDANNFVVAAMGQVASAAATFTASVGNLRSQQAAGAGIPVLGLNDNTAASAGSVVNTVTSNKSNLWACCAVELRSTSPGGSTSKNLLMMMGVGS